MSDTRDERDRGREDPDPPPTDVHAPPPPPAPPWGPSPAPSYGQAPAAPDPYGQAPYGQTPHGQTPSPYGPPQGYPGGYGSPSPSNASLIALTITAGITAVLCCNLLGLPALVLGIVGLTKQSSDPAGAARMARYGWIAFAVSAVLVVLAALVFVAIGVSGGFDDTSTTFGGY